MAEAFAWALTDGCPLGGERGRRGIILTSLLFFLLSDSHHRIAEFVTFPKECVSGADLTLAGTVTGSRLTYSKHTGTPVEF